tara:strand:- start:680 stop:850 length:171 start_codon:yes stop_codon:yes gene_type:complete
MNKWRFSQHICDTYFRKRDDEIFEYCKCGAKYFINRRPKQNIKLEGFNDDIRGQNK